VYDAHEFFSGSQGILFGSDQVQGGDLEGPSLLVHSGLVSTGEHAVDCDASCASPTDQQTAGLEWVGLPCAAHRPSRNRIGEMK